jgi:hypothetical protein
MTKNFLIFLIIIVIFCMKISAQSSSIINTTNEFEIIYEADVQYANNNLWLEKIRDNWSATGINLRIFRAFVESNDGKLTWTGQSYNVDDALTKISKAGLNIYIRISLSTLNSQSVDNFYNDNDFHMRSNGNRILNEYEINNPILNLTSIKSRDDLLNFISSTVKHLKTFPDNIRSKIKLIVPTLSPDDETELPFNTYDKSSKSILNEILTGFSNPEISAFMDFLKNKYGSVNSLNESWGNNANFTQFDSSQIHIRNYNWDGVKSDRKALDYYIFETGRKDFLDFRRAELKRFIDDCSQIVNQAGFNFGVQFGSIYDGLIEFRGFYDPTPLIENVDELITGDILEYYPNFTFSADYSRSLCKYWTWKNKSDKPITFATELNWPGYASHSANDLIKYWALQLRTFYEKGASCLFVSHWGTYRGPNNVSEKVIAEYPLSDYRDWQDTLKKFQNAPVKMTKNDFAFNLSCEQGLNYRGATKINVPEESPFVHNEGFIVGSIGGRNILEFPLNRFSRILGENKENIYYANKGDFVTNYMIQNSPDYVRDNYKYYYLTGTGLFKEK